MNPEWFSHFNLVYHAATAAGFARRALQAVLEGAGIPPAAAHIFALEVAFIASSLWPTYEHLQQRVTRELLAAATGAGAVAEASGEQAAALAMEVAAPGVPDDRATRARVSVGALLSYFQGRREWDGQPIPSDATGDAAAYVQLLLFARRLNHLRRCSRGGTSNRRDAALAFHLCMFDWALTLIQSPSPITMPPPRLLLLQASPAVRTL
jgi:hypothetical protein